MELSFAKGFYLYTLYLQLANKFILSFSFFYNSSPLSIFSCYTSELYLHYILDIAMDWIEINMSAYEYETNFFLYNIFITIAYFRDIFFCIIAKFFSQKNCRFFVENFFYNNVCV